MSVAFRPRYRLQHKSDYLRGRLVSLLEGKRYELRITTTVRHSANIDKQRDFVLISM